MSVSAGRAIIKDASKKFLARWNSTKMMWRDENSRQFEEKFLTELLAKLRKAEGVMEHMDAVLNRVRHDCT
ncbi:MAG: hypothetical protein JSV03_07060 [Planctomycetota bacterium]|nr:MAG: hypothetical protein JSV03_07060 [Planctomycetota bacterium]